MKTAPRTTLDFGAWKDRVAFIIGGGPSLLKTLPDPNVLMHKNVISTNNAYKLTPWAHILHFADAIWWQWHKTDIPSVFKGKHITTCAPGNTNGRQWAPLGITYIPRLKDRGLAANRGALHGSNAGHQAINLAVHMGASTVVLIGFDMDDKATETHWHDEHRRTTNRHAYREIMLPGMNSLAKDAEKFGVSVINVNPHSAIKCFPFVPLKDYLDA